MDGAKRALRRAQVRSDPHHTKRVRTGYMHITALLCVCNALHIVLVFWVSVPSSPGALIGATAVGSLRSVRLKEAYGTI